jgi:hypothetical protein
MPLPAYLKTLSSAEDDNGVPGYLFHSEHDFERAQGLLADLDLPKPILALGDAAMHRFFVGPALTGTLPHLHTYAVNALTHGRRRWAIYAGPTAMAQPGTRGRAPRLRDRVTGGGLVCRGMCGAPATSPSRALGFVQEKGEVVYAPPGFVHAVLNLEEAVGFTVELDGADRPGRGTRRPLFGPASPLQRRRLRPRGWGRPIG